MKLYKTNNGPVLAERGEYFLLPDTDWDVLVNRDDHEMVITSLTRRATRPGGVLARTRRARANRQAGGLGGGRDLFSQPDGANGGIEIRGRRRFLRSHLRR